MIVKISISTFVVLTFAFTLFASSARAIEVPNASKSGAPCAIDDTEAGWIWSQMVEYDDSGLQGGTGHAGGPGSYGAYTFHGRGVDVVCMTGPSLRLDNRVHRLGRARFSLDGKVVQTVDTSTPDTDYGVTLFHSVGLTDSVHVLQIEPEDGWIVVDALRVYQSVDQAADPTAKPGPPAVDANTAVDRLVDWSNVSHKSANWYLDATNADYYLGDTSRAARSVNDTEYLTYSVKNMTTFNALIYSWRTPITSDTAFFLSTDNGVTFSPLVVKYGTKTYTTGPWGYYNVTPASTLPPGVTDIAIQFGVSDNNWDPELSQISISHL